MWPTIEDAKDPNYHKVGSHSFNTVSPDGKFDYAAACKGCHADIKDFNLTAKADYDGNGKIEGVQDEVKGLLERPLEGIRGQRRQEGRHRLSVRHAAHGRRPRS